MKVQLNSDPSYFPKALEGIDKGFGLYSVADTFFEDKNERVEFANNLVRKISSFVSKIPGTKLKGESKVFLDRNSENIKYLKESTLDSFTKNLLVQLNIDTVPNRILKAIYSEMGEAENNTHLKEVADSLSNNKNYMLTYEKDDSNEACGIVQKGSLVVSANVSDPFFQTMIEKIGLEKTFDFVFFHEAAHHMEEFANKNFQNPMNKNINAFLGKIVNAQKLGHKDLVDPETFTTIKHNIAGSLDSLKKEIYADTISILILRNRDILQGIYNQQETLKLIDDVGEVRADSHKMNNKGRDSSLSYFTHSTSVAMDYLYEKIQSKGATQMSMQEMDVFAKDIQSVALARTLHTLKISAGNDFIPQLNTIACVSFNDQTGMPFVNPENRGGKFIEQNKIIENIAGLEWVAKLDEKIKKYPNLSSSYIFDIGCSHEIKSTRLPDVSASVINIMQTRAKFLSPSSPKQVTPTH